MTECSKPNCSKKSECFPILKEGIWEAKAIAYVINRSERVPVLVERTVDVKLISQGKGFVFIDYNVNPERVTDTLGVWNKLGDNYSLSIVKDSFDNGNIVISPYKYREEKVVQLRGIYTEAGFSEDDTQQNPVVARIEFRWKSDLAKSSSKK